MTEHPIECRVRIESEDEEMARVRWELRRGAESEPFAAGHVSYELETVHFYWDPDRPPREHEALVRTTIDRAIRGRDGAA